MQQRVGTQGRIKYRYAQGQALKSSRRRAVPDLLRRTEWYFRTGRKAESRRWRNHRSLLHRKRDTTKEERSGRNQLPSKKIKDTTHLKSYSRAVKKERTETEISVLVKRIMLTAFVRLYGCDYFCTNLITLMLPSATTRTR